MKVNFLHVAILFFSAAYSVHAQAQWAVYDHEVKKILELMNKSDNLSGYGRNSTYPQYQGERTSEGDIKFGDGDNSATLKSLDTEFEDGSKLPQLTDEEKLKYVGTEADCGQKEASPQHWAACMGLRNLRLQTLVQSQALLKNIAARRGEIVKVIHLARDIPTGTQASAGQLQRAQFEIQGQQALLQADSFSLQVLMDGYRQREQVYMLQQAEARKSMLSQAKMGKSAKAPPFVPFIRAAPSNN